MAKKSSIAKQKRREQLVALKQDKRAELKSIIYDMNRSEEERHEAVMNLNKMSRDSSKVRLRNRCVLTGRCRGVYRKFKLSRLKFREMASNGLIPGVTKASW